MEEWSSEQRSDSRDCWTRVRRGKRGVDGEDEQSEEG